MVDYPLFVSVKITHFLAQAMGWYKQKQVKMVQNFAFLNLK